MVANLKCGILDRQPERGRSAMTNFSLNAVNFGNILKRAVESFNPGHLAQASQRRVPENKLVEHIRTELLRKPNTQVTKHFSHQYDYFGAITFLYQPGVDLFVRYDGFLHGVEVKLPTEKNNFVFYKGADEALAQSTYGLDCSWIIHFYPIGYANLHSYQKWMEYTIKHSRCPSIGYIAATTKTCELCVCPTKPFSRSLQVDKDLMEAVSHIRKNLERILENSAK